MVKLTSQYIIAQLEKHKEDLHKFGIIKIGLFGSFSHNQATEKSDIDFLVEFDDATFDKYMDCKFFLEELFSRKVDLVTKQSLKPSLHYVREEALYAQVA